MDVRPSLCFRMDKTMTHTFKCVSHYFGGDKRDRTADLLNAIQALSQLSYTPMLPESLDSTGFPGCSIF